MLPRALQGEWLDELPAGDPRAIRSRADLRRVNALMGNARHIAKALRALLPGTGTLKVADLGAGDGALSLAVARRLGRARVRLALVDRAPVVHGVTLEHLNALGWRASIAASDVFDFLERGGEALDAVFVNLFLHHFDDANLARLLRLVAARTRALVACEPRRSPLALAGSHLLWAIGCNDVTRHDAVASVRAGFAGSEISALWPRSTGRKATAGGNATAGWKTVERGVLPFSHLFIACAATRS